MAHLSSEAPFIIGRRFPESTEMFLLVKTDLNEFCIALASGMASVRSHRRSSDRKSDLDNVRRATPRALLVPSAKGHIGDRLGQPGNKSLPSISFHNVIATAIRKNIRVVCRDRKSRNAAWIFCLKKFQFTFDTSQLHLRRTAQQVCEAFLQGLM